MDDDPTLKIKVEMDASQSEAAAARHQRLWTDANGKVRDEFGKFATSAEAAAFKASMAGQSASRDFGAVGDVVREGRAMLGEYASALQGIGQMAGGIRAIHDTFTGLVSVANIVTNAQRAANEESARQLETLLRTKDAIREIATIKGVLNGDRALMDHLAIRSATGMDQSQAAAFSGELAGAGESMKGLNISAPEYGRLEGMSARFAKSQGGDAGAMGTYGKLTGLLLGYKKYGTAEDVMREQSRLVELMSAGVGDNPTLLRQSAETAGTFLNPNDPMKGAFKSTGELGAFIGTASRISPTQSGDILRIMHRAVNPNLAATSGHEGKWSGMLKGLGVTEAMDDTSRVRLLFGAMQQQEQAGRRPDAWLKEQGLVDSESANRLVQLYGNRSFLEQQLGAAGKPLDADPMARVNNKYASDSALLTDVARQKLESGKIQDEMPYQMQSAWEFEATERLRRQGLNKDSGNWMLGAMSGGGTFYGDKGAQGFGWDIRMEQEMKRMAEERGLSLGDQRPSDPVSLKQWISSGEYKKAYGALGETERMGGAAAPESAEDRKLMEEQNGYLKQMADGINQFLAKAIFNADISRPQRRPTPPGGPTAR